MPNTSQIAPTVVSCYGGLVLNKDIFSMRPGEALQLTNFEPDIAGGYKKILGTTAYNSNIVPQVSSSSEIVDMAAIFNDVVLAARGGTISRAGSSGSWTSIATGKSTSYRYDFERYNYNGTEKIMIATGGDAAFSIDTSYNVDIINATGGGTAPTNPKFVSSFKNHMFYAGMSNAISTVQYSGPYTEDDFDTGGGTILVDTTIVGLKVFREDLFIFGEDRIYKLSGSSTSDFSIVPVTRRIGCLDGKSIQELGGDLIYLAPDGLRTIAGTERIGDVELGTVSKQIQDRISDMGTDNITSTVIRNKSQYRLFYPTTGQTESAAKGILAVLKANPETGTLGFEYADLRGLKPSCTDSFFISDTETTIHGGYDGYVYKQESGGSFTRAGSTYTITGFYRSPDMALGDPGIRKTMQRALVNYKVNEAMDTTNQTFKLRYNYDDTDTPQPDSYSFSSAQVAAFYGSGLYGTSAYGSSGFPLERVSVEGSGFVVAFKLEDKSTKKALSLRGFELEYVNGGRR
jgi:hypothetical protein